MLLKKLLRHCEVHLNQNLQQEIQKQLGRNTVEAYILSVLEKICGYAISLVLQNSILWNLEIFNPIINLSYSQYA